MENFVADMIFIDAAADKVFSSLLNPHDVLEWMDAEEAVIGAWHDGEFNVKRNDGTCLAAIVAKLTPNVELVLRDFYWEESDQRRGPTKLQFQLNEQDGGVWFSVRHDDLDTDKDWEAFAERMRRQWVRATTALKRHVEGI